jgi:hypothetical protein
MAIEFTVTKDDLSHALKPFFGRSKLHVEVRAAKDEVEFITADFVSSAKAEVASLGGARIPYAIFKALFHKPANLAWSAGDRILIRITPGKIQAGTTSFSHPEVVVRDASPPTLNVTDSDTVRSVPTKDLQCHPELMPKRDDTFMQLAERALKGELPVYFAAVPLAQCVPFDLDYRPDRHPVGRQAIQSTAQEGARSNFTKMIVYPRGAWFVVADDYIPLFAALLGHPDYVPCWVLGKPEADYAVDIQGPIDTQGVRSILGFSGGGRELPA